MKVQKIAIIGAGITGLYLAWKLSENGHKVTVFEKKGKIGKDCCSGLFSERILKFIPESKSLIQNQINSVLIHFPKKTLNVRFSGKFLVMSHFGLDNLVAAISKKAGARIVLNHPVNVLPEGFDRTIGCDGADSLVRKSLGLKDPAYRLGAQRFVLKEDFSDFVETWPKNHGFSWKIPRGKETEYGIIGRPEAVKGFSQIEKSALIPQGFIIPKNPKVTLCGDAAGLTKPWSGGGVIWGLIAADILLQTFPDFRQYRKKMRRYFLPKIAFSRIATKIVYLAGFKFPWLLPKNIKIEGDFLL